MAARNSKLCLVTGGAGFIGSHLVDGLLEAGYRVRVLDNLSTGNRANLKESLSRIEWLKGDIRNQNDVQRAVQGVDTVFHVAANRAVLRSVEHPLETNEVNVTGTLRLLLASRETGVRRFIFSSSSSVYGAAKHFPLREDEPSSPQSPYAATKAAGEYYCKVFHSVYGLETVVLRYFNVFGPRQHPESRYSAVIPIFIRCFLRNDPPEVHWDGHQSRDFSYVDNIVSGNLLAIRRPGIGGETFNIACHEEASVLEILKSLRKILDRRGARPLFRPKRAGDVRRTLADIRKAQKVLGYRVKTRFQEGLEKTVQWFLKRS